MKGREGLWWWWWGGVGGERAEEAKLLKRKWSKKKSELFNCFIFHEVPSNSCQVYLGDEEPNRPYRLKNDQSLTWAQSDDLKLLKLLLEPFMVF